MKDNSVPGRTQIARFASSDAANPRVPKPKLRVVSLSPIFAFARVDVVKAVVAHRGVLLIAPARWIDFIAFTYTDATRSLTRRHPTGTRKRC